ncbi:MAG: hypothetical protein AB2A00_24720 [Myxococcota bacterium]
MLVQCPACKELVKLVQFSARDDVLTFTCTACRAQNRMVSGQVSAPPPAQSTPPSVAAPSPTSTETTPPPPLVEHTPPGGSIPPLPAIPPSASSPPVTAQPGTRDAVLWAAWEKVHADWANERAHDHFIAMCQAADALPFAGTRYKEHLLKRPEDPLAKRGRDRVLAQAIALAHSSRIERSTDEPGSSKRIMRVVLVAVAMLVGALMVRQISVARHATESTAEE